MINELIESAQRGFDIYIDVIIFNLLVLFGAIGLLIIITFIILIIKSLIDKYD